MNGARLHARLAPGAGAALPATCGVYRPPHGLPLVGCGIAEIGLDAAVDLHRHRIATAVQRTADGDPDPALAHAVFLDVGALLAVEDDADAAAEDRFVVMRAGRVVAEAVGRGLRHVDSIARGRPSGAPRPSRSGSASPSATKPRATEFRQWRSPVGGGPSGNTWPRWLPQRAQTSSTRTMPWLVSRTWRTCAGSSGWKKLGQPVPESNLVLERNSGRPHSPQV